MPKIGVVDEEIINSQPSEVFKALTMNLQDRNLGGGPFGRRNPEEKCILAN